MDRGWVRAWIGNDSRVVGRTRRGKTTQTSASSHTIAFSVGEAIQRSPRSFRPWKWRCGVPVRGLDRRSSTTFVPDLPTEIDSANEALAEESADEITTPALQGQLRAHVNWRHPANGEFCKALMNGRCRRGVIHWVKRHFRCTESEARPIPRAGSAAVASHVLPIQPGLRHEIWVHMRNCPHKCNRTQMRPATNEEASGLDMVRNLIPEHSEHTQISPRKENLRKMKKWMRETPH